MNKFLKNYGIYGLGVFLIYCWVEYYTLLRNNSNDEEFNLLLIMTVFIILLITSTTVILPYYLLYSSQFKRVVFEVSEMRGFSFRVYLEAFLNSAILSIRKLL